jgi:hypothetical protein
MNRFAPVTALLALWALSGCGASVGKKTNQENPSVSKILLQDVPKAALMAAEHQVPGIYIHGVSIIRQPMHDVYEIKGLSHHRHYEIYVTAEGLVLDIDEDRSLSD